MSIIQEDADELSATVGKNKSGIHDPRYDDDDSKSWFGSAGRDFDKNRRRTTVKSLRLRNMDSELSNNLGRVSDD
jgi:hypothetical protein